MNIRLIISLIIIALLAFCSCEKDRQVKFDLEYSTFTDNRDGYEYKTVTIDGTTWLAENFRYLPSVDGNDVDSVSFDGLRYYVYNYNGTNVNEAKATDEYKKYDRLYNYDAAIKSCPDGWRLPTMDDFQKLFKSINRTKYEGTYSHGQSLDYNTIIMMCGQRELWGLKDSGYDLLNVSGLDFVPGGVMKPEWNYDTYTGKDKELLDSVIFNDLGNSCLLWKKKKGQEKDYISAWRITYDSQYEQIDFDMRETLMQKVCGLSVRYVKD